MGQFNIVTSVVSRTYTVAKGTPFFPTVPKLDFSQKDKEIKTQNKEPNGDMERDEHPCLYVDPY
jgi:hypothetical protein